MQFSGHTDRLHNLFFVCPFFKGLGGMVTYAIWTLRDMSYCHCDQSFSLFWKNTFFKNSFAEIAPSLNAVKHK